MKIIRTGHWCIEDVKTAHSYPSPLQIPSDNEEAAEFLFSLLSSTAHSVLVAAILCLKALAEVYSHHTVKEENVEVTCNFSSPPPKRFFEKHSKRTRGNGHKKQQEIFQSDARKKIFWMRVVTFWTKLPGQAVGPPPTEISATQPDESPHNLTWPCSENNLLEPSPEASSNLNIFKLVHFLMGIFAPCSAFLNRRRAPVQNCSCWRTFSC